ncbi:hypothetical protein P175DRAFT_014360 [Aspergillus ochraceoroseus IBT 24754]|uniref:Uncharacterized protein n=1 Tax=Aspergillus ochraceoroseus IBT 24754 TaxID=1392256 RepID=A0A2T5M607_9EURO|nr:uncharacterized protein P175DRAFT_014360 [Aspergillus ochraceoroseus IBT 24754]PTU23962.1 hypothetical protein P175DRAFT_014360 [Aspergillus ochraceoroseus IBT 24754]
MVGRPLPSSRDEDMYRVNLATHPDLDSIQPWLGARTYHFHERCWQLALRVLGPRIKEEPDLGLFLLSLRRGGRLHRIIAARFEEAAPLMLEYREWFRAVRKRQGRSLRQLRKSPQDYRSYVCSMVQLVHGRARLPDLPAAVVYGEDDPWNNIDVRDLIDEAVRRRQQQQRESASRREGGGRCRQRRSTSPSPTMLVRMPMDLQMLVVDHLHEPRDILALGLAFRWRLPETYWRARFPKHLVFEYAALHAVELDWEYLCLGAEKLIATQKLWRREWVLGCLEEVRLAFEELWGQRGQHRDGDGDYIM